MSELTESALRGTRLGVLRDLRGLSQGELARELDVSQSFISHVEKGSRPLPPGVAAAASVRFSVPVSFFQVTEGAHDLGQYTFRKKARASVRDERRVKALYDEASRLFFQASVQSGLGEVVLPDPSDYAYDPEECAEAIRSRAGLDHDEPLKNVVRFVERFGVGVITHLDDTDLDVSDHDGISRPSQLNNRPLVAATREQVGAIQRLTIGHEFAHLLFDRSLAKPIGSTRAEEEGRAFRFAGALLVPSRVMHRRVSPSLSLHGYLRIKADYGISVGALIRRARELGIITNDRYRSLAIQLSSQGWRSNEPVTVATEEPRLLGQALRKIHGSSVYQAAPGAYGLDPNPLRQWLADPLIGQPAVEDQARVITFPVNRSGDQR